MRKLLTRSISVAMWTFIQTALAPACGTDGESGDSEVTDTSDSFDSTLDDLFTIPDASDLDLARDYSTADSTGEDIVSSADINISNLQVIENPANVLSFYVEWRTDRASSTRLEVTCGTYYEQTFLDSHSRSEHSVFVMGLIEESTCEVVAYATDEQERHTNESTTFEVASIPIDVPTPTVVVMDEARMQPGWTIFNLNNRSRALPPTVVIVDQDGYFRWYYVASSVDSGLDNAVRVIPEGILTQVPPQIIDWEGSVVWEKHLPMHHEVLTYRDDHLLFLSGGECPGQPHSDSIIEYDRGEDRILWEWKICEHYTPPELHEDWSHLNSIEPFPGENALLISSRHQNAVFKIDMDSDDVVWRLGFLGDFEMHESDYSYNNHSAQIVPNGNILLFDNGDEQRRYSRAIEIEYNDSGPTWEAEVVWEYVPSPHIFCFSWGDADRLPNGNTLMSFGVEFQEDGQSHIIEATHDTPAQTVWDVEFPLGWAMYRADRIVNPPMGYVITD